MHSLLESSLSHCRSLPSPPGVAMRIIDLAQDPDVDLVSMTEVLSLDSALSARMLRIANSPLYATRRRVDNLGQALTILGVNAAMNLALGFSLVQGLAGDDMPRQYDRIWRRSVLSALAARLLGQRVGQRKLEELMMAGLLQDIGVLALLRLQPERYAALLASTPDNARLLERERETFGDDHSVVGHWLASHWNLPDYLRRAILASESEHPEGTFERCVAVSGSVADIWLSADTETTFAAASARMEALLGLDTDALNSLITEMSQALPDICTLFDVSIPQPEGVTALLEQAQELLMLRNLQQLQNVTDAHQQADESESKLRQLSEQAARDPLTGIYNRAQLEELLAKEYGIAQRFGWPLSVAFIDLDDFKKVNDRHGHLIGDQVLRNFAQALEAGLRKSDVVARFGGEEFVVLLPNTPLGNAASIIERLRERIATLPMATTDGQQVVHVTFSAGLATESTDEHHPDTQSLLKSADDALYGAKRDGRNRVVSNNKPIPGDATH